MGYRDDLIERMQAQGTWEHLAPEAQARLQSFTDDQARRYLVVVDSLDMGDTNAWAKLGVAGLNVLVSAFRMNLFEMDIDNKPTLSRAGTLLATFVRELQDSGLDIAEIEEGLKNLPYSAIGLLANSRLQ